MAHLYEVHVSFDIIVQTDSENDVLKKRTQQIKQKKTIAHRCVHYVIQFSSLYYRISQ